MKGFTVQQKSKDFTAKQEAKGFTLLELIIAIAIIAVLTSVGLITYQGVSEKNRNQTRYRDLTGLKQALELYRHDRHHYPASVNELVPKYVGTVPLDPDNLSKTYYYRAYDRNSVICSPSTVACVNYKLCAAGEGTHTLGDPGACSTVNCGAVRCNMSIINQ